MNYQQEYEQEIDLRDLLFYILYRWRSIMLVSAVVCILFCGYAVVQNNVRLSGDSPNRQVSVEKSEDEGTEGETDVESSAEGLKTINVGKNSIIGLMAGMILVVFYYGMGYIISDKVRGDRELKERYGYYMLGMVPANRRKRFLSCIDNLLDMLAGAGEHITEDEAYRIIVANIINLAKDGETFLVTGTVGIEILQEFVDRVASQLHKNITLQVGANMNITAATLEMLSKCDAVILVEKSNYSMRMRIQKEQDSIAVLDKSVLGYVMLAG